MNRRTLLKGTGGLAASLILTRSAHVFAQGSGELPTLTITVTDDGFEIPEGLTAGRYAVSVVNAGSAPSHSSLGRLPDGVANDQVMADMSSDSEELPDWFLNAGYVGLPDWAAPGETRTGVVDLSAGNYFMFDPFSSRNALVTVAEGSEMGAEPDSVATVEMTEMHFMLPESGLPTGSARLKVTNIGAIPHEFQVVAVPEGTTTEQIAALFSMPEDASAAPDDELAQGSSMVHIPGNVQTVSAAPDNELAQGSSMVHIPGSVQRFSPAPDDELAQVFANYAPVAATSILGASLTSWIDVDLAPGTYAVTCALPFPSGVPHAMEGMLAVVTVG